MTPSTRDNTLLETEIKKKSPGLESVGVVEIASVQRRVAGRHERAVTVNADRGTPSPADQCAALSDPWIPSDAIVVPGQATYPNVTPGGGSRIFQGTRDRVARRLVVHRLRRVHRRGSSRTAFPKTVLYLPQHRRRS